VEIVMVASPSALTSKIKIILINIKLIKNNNINNIIIPWAIHVLNISYFVEDNLSNAYHHQF